MPVLLLVVSESKGVAELVGDHHSHHVGELSTLAILASVAVSVAVTVAVVFLVFVLLVLKDTDDTDLAPIVATETITMLKRGNYRRLMSKFARNSFTYVHRVWLC